MWSSRANCGCICKALGQFVGAYVKFKSEL